jgi:hypothetical protein
MRIRLLVALSLIIAVTALCAVIGGAAPSFGGNHDAAAAGDGALTAELEQARLELSDARRELRRARDSLESKADRIRDLRRRLNHSSRVLARIRAAAGQHLPLTDGACSVNLALAAARGLTLPTRFKLHCPGPGLDWNGVSHWGITCPYDQCPEGAGPYVSISNPNYYVVAHELCHAMSGYSGSPRGELRADACAAKHGASLESSPYK